jgi:hypothetical protein
MDLSQPRLRHVEMIASRIACVAASRVGANVVGQEEWGRGVAGGHPHGKSGRAISGRRTSRSASVACVVAADGLPMAPR